jgi:hypothetical protein
VKGPELGEVKVPEPVANVYRDMRDRHLLWVALALVIAIIAVPFLLGGDSSSPVPPSSATVTQVSGTEQIDPVVLADVPGLRNFHKRLDRYRSRNPFQQQMTNIPGQTSDTGGTNGGGNLPTASTAPTTTPSTSTSTSTTDSAPSNLPTGTPSSPDTPASTPPDSGGGSGGTHASLITYRIDVRVGPVGDTKVLRDVKNLELLPDRHKPIVQYIQSDGEDGRSSFIVSPDATVLKGDGRCSKPRSTCHFLQMKAGDDQYFRYEPDGKTYRLELLAINQHSEPLRGGKGSDQSSKTGRWGFASSSSVDR